MLRNVFLLARSEFLRRIRGKWFWIGTLFAPLALVAGIGAVAAIGVMTVKSSTSTVAVVDEGGALARRLVAASTDNLRFEAARVPERALRDSVTAEVLDAFLVLPPSLAGGLADSLAGIAPDATSGAEALLYTGSGGGLTLRASIERAVSDAVRAERLDRLNVPAEVEAALGADVSVRAVKLTADGEQADSLIGDAAVGYAMGILIYMTMLIYGSVVMQGVLEEKQNRVVEVMVSAVRPFELLMGKVLGIGAMGLVQLVLWTAIAGAALGALGSGAGALMMPDGGAGMPAGAGMPEAPGFPTGALLPNVTAGLVAAFFFYFIGGYLLYASLFAAIGSSVEQAQDAQGLTLPIMLPIILAFASLSFVLDNPTSPTATILSLVPFFSPILMPVRLAVADIPFWEVLLSYACLMAGFVGAVWLSARIYRVGILSYGKKPTLRDLGRWLRYSG